MIKYKIIFFAFLLFRVVMLHGQEMQRYKSFSYSVNEGMLQSTINDAAFDKNNFFWISFPNGIQKFDGKNFINVPVQPGLPDDKWVFFFRCSNGDMLVSHSKGISKYDISNNSFIQVYKNPASEITPALIIGEDDNIIFFYTSAGNIIGLNNRTFKIVKEIRSGLPDFSSNSKNRPKISDNIINHKVALLGNYTLYLWDLQKEKMLFQSPVIPEISYFFLALKTESEVLYYNVSRDISLELYNFENNKKRIVSVKQKNSVQPFRSVVYSWPNKTLLSFYNHLYETDSSLHILKTELVNFQNQSIAGNSPIAHIKEDNFGNLYLITINDGFRKIIRNNYSIKYYGTEKKEDNYVLSIFPDKKNNRILAGTYKNGLLVFDTLQRLIKHIRTLPGKSHSFSPNTIIKDNNGNYLLFAYGEKNVWKLNNNFSKLIPIKITASLPANKILGIEYFSNFLFQNEQEAVIHSQMGLYRYNFAANTVIEYDLSNSYTTSAMIYNDYIITHANDDLIFLDAATFKVRKKIVFRNTGGVRCFAKDAANNIYIGSNKGIFKIDPNGKILQQWNKKTGLPDECIYAMTFDSEGYLWCSTNKGILKINKDNTVLQLKKDDGLQENEFNTNVVAKADDGEIFFGGINGVSSFYPAAINNVKDKVKLLITGIKINNVEAFTDTAVWNIDNINLPYNQNNLSFDFIAMANNNPDQYIYQYKMEGIDDQWIQNNGMQTVRYFLPPGEYVFKLYASRIFDKDVKPMKEINITIYPPYWKTWWFYTVLALIFIITLTLVINQYNQRKYEKRLLVLEGEQKLRIERERISRDLHDSLGAYANAVLYNSELLQKEENAVHKDQILNDLRFASKDIITALRDTIWALKKDTYSAEDCMLRIRNFLQPLMRYYPNINFKVEGEVPREKTFSHNKAFHLVRIVQEAISNAIEHADAKNLSIKSSIAKEKWQLNIQDDGVGFNYAEVKEVQKGNGLDNMEKRASESGLAYSITSKMGKGTSVTVNI